MDLSLFQFDFDLTFAAFFLNADRSIYGRFGTRAGHEADEGITVEGFRKAMEAALELHRGYPANRTALEGKQPRAVAVKSPEQFPSLRGKFKPDLDYQGAVAKSCIHCHQVRDAERLVLRTQKRSIPDPELFPYPLPDDIGLTLDPAECATVQSVRPDSAAAAAGFLPGDEIVTFSGQPIISVADVQWVLHQAADECTIPAQVRRGGQLRRLSLRLDAGWRRAGNIAWRTSTWDLRRMGTGGLVLEDLDAEARQRAGLADSALALVVKHVGQYGDHAVAKHAGFQKDDIIVAFDGRSERMSESLLIAYALQKRSLGDRVPVTVLRGDRKVELELPLQ